MRIVPEWEGCGNSCDGLVSGWGVDQRVTVGGSHLKGVRARDRITGRAGHSGRDPTRDVGVLERVESSGDAEGPCESGAQVRCAAASLFTVTVTIPAAGLILIGVAKLGQVLDDAGTNADEVH